MERFVYIFNFMYLKNISRTTVRSSDQIQVDNIID